MKISRNIETVSSISPEEFEEKYFRTQKPVIIKGLGYRYPAGWKWSMNYLSEVCGDVNVALYDNNKNNNGSAYTRHDLNMKFGEYAELVKKEKASNLRMFLFNMFKKKPALRKDFPCPDIFKGILGRIGYMFFGSKGIKVRINQDIDMSSVLLTQFEGRKKIVLIHPKYSDLLYKLPFNTYSLVDLDNIDTDKYPGLEFVEAQECILEHGDALFMPSGYWHYITYLDTGFGVSYRKLAPSLKTVVQGLIYLGILMPIDKIMNFFVGKWWLERKELEAQVRAYRAMKKLMPRYTKVLQKNFPEAQLRFPGF
jgi:hypothetical protein